MPKKKSRAAPFECRDKSDPDPRCAATCTVAESLLSTAECFRKMGDGITRMAFHLQSLNMFCEKERKRKAENLEKGLKNHKKRKLHEIYETEESDSYTTVEEGDAAEACQGTRTPARGFIADKMGKIINVKFPPGKKEEMMNAVTAELPEYVKTRNLEEVDRRLRVLAWLATCE